MTVFIENEKEAKFDFDYEEVIKNVINESLDYVKCPFDVNVEVTITDNDEIRKINKEQRDIDSATDVLSFPMVEYEVAGYFDFLEVEDDYIYEYFEPDSGELMLGDIVISWERVYSQAAEYGHSVKRELAFLVVHSMLHLFGYDHMEDDEREVMETKQREILDNLGITRD